MFSLPTKQSGPSPSSSNRGYFAFPNGVPLTLEQKFRALEISTNESRSTGRTSAETHPTNNEEDEEKERRWKKCQEETDQRRRLYEEREREQALIGEKYWVKQGGMLRDKDGRRDPVRTEWVRKIVEKEETERRIRERWDTYEESWTKLMSRSPTKEYETVTYKMIPWPLLTPPTSIDDLHDQKKISDFLFESLTLEGNKITRKERLRASLLRWHPDKLQGVIARVSEEEQDEVKDSIDAVIMTLMKIQEAEKVARQ